MVLNVRRAFWLLLLALAQVSDTAAFDVDDDGTTEALTDGLLVLRHQFGFIGQTLVDGALGSGASRIDPAEIATYLANQSETFDIDGNNTVDALTDGLLLLRYLFGFSGESLRAGVVGQGATRSNSDALGGYMVEHVSASETPVDGGLPLKYEKFDSGVAVVLEEGVVVITSNGVPNHKSPYFLSSDDRYEAYDGNNQQFNLNPNRINEFDMEFRVPVVPAEDPNHEPTPLGPIGVAVNGVAIYNQYAGPNNRALTFEINSFDQYNGHPQQTGMYHYHVEPLWITANRGRDAFLGVLLDGFSVYGPEDFGAEVEEDALDEFHGHVGITVDSTQAIYHYHVTDKDPYINGSGFYGTAGTFAE